MREGDFLPIWGVVWEVLSGLPKIAGATAGGLLLGENTSMRIVICIVALAMGGSLKAQVMADDPQARPPVTKADLAIVKRAREILDSPSKWNRADNRICPETAKTFSLYCALEKATIEKSGNFEHRGAAMQEARFVIEGVAPNLSQYQHRLMDYNNDPTTTFADVQKVFRLLEDRIAKRLAGEPVEVSAPVTPPSSAGSGTPAAAPVAPSVTTPVTQADLEVVRRARAILDSPAKWNRADTQVCDAEPKTVSLFCSFEMASKEVNGAFDDEGAAIQEARMIISEMDPHRLKYHARLKDYNNDPAITFADVQKVFQLVEERLTNRLVGK